MKRILALALLVIGTAGATPLQMDSQIVLQRYELEMDDVTSPKAMIFSYAVSQLGPTDIEQRHRIYREGLNVRDETIAVDGQALSHKIVRIGRRADRYTVAHLAPRAANYSFLFLHTLRRNGHVDYVYEATPLAPAATSGFVVKRVTIDGARFLPRSISFTTAGAQSLGTGQIEFTGAGKYWVPTAITVDARVAGKPARERITWGDYSFPPDLPAGTFAGAKPLPHATLPPF